ncbi:HET-domain-containing protein, partial [Polyplosphaeria fusca]
MQAFSYTPIDLERPAFRLLQLRQGQGPVIECLLHQVYIDGPDTVPYHAVSYTWGDTEKTSSAMVDGKVLGVTENLYIALQHLRLKDVDQVLWIDAICINQDDLRERKHQVEHMCKIYSHAEEVTVWLGGATDETDMTMDSLGRLEEYSLMYPHRNWNLARWTQLWLSVPQSTKGNPRKGLELLLQRPWFRRVWILQEVANAKRARVWCGTKSIKSRTFTLAPKLMNVEPERHCQAVLDIMPGSLREESWWSGSRDLYNLLLKFKEAKATDPRDKVYALLGIALKSPGTEHRDAPRPDYKKTPQKVACDTASFLFGLSDVSYETVSELIEDVVSREASFFCQLLKESDTIEVGKFLMRRGLEVPLSENMIKAAAGNAGNGKDIINLLLQQRGSEVKVTEGVIQAAAGNAASGKDIINLLIQQRRSEVEVTEEVIKAAAGNAASGKDVITLLLQQRGSEVKVTEEVIKAAARNKAGRKDVITLLVQQRRREGRMTEVIEAATGIGKGGAWILEHINTLQKVFTECNWIVVKMLLEENCDVNALQRASSEGHQATVKMLLDAGAEVNAQGKEYGNALYAASWGGHEAVVKLLLDKG